MGDTLVVGDVHGCADELAELLDRTQPARVVLVGDLYTRGPDPVGVARIVLQPGVTVVRGNQDQRLLDAIEGAPAGAAAPVIAALDAGAPGWRLHLAATPLTLDLEPFLVVHAGLPPDGDWASLPLGVFLNLRFLPDGRRWTDAYTAERPVLYGHDAVRGLHVVRRAGRPWLLGLDSGCVYGGHLTGYLVERDALEQVRARAQWFVPRG